MSLSDTTPAPKMAGTSYLAAVHRTDRTRSRQRCGIRPWLSNLSICRLLFTSACSVEPNNKSCKRSSRQLRMAEADVSLPSQCSPVISNTSKSTTRNAITQAAAIGLLEKIERRTQIGSRLK